jgi:hypothetical protein
MAKRKTSDDPRSRQVELALEECRDALKAIAAYGDNSSAWAARKALNSTNSKLRRANV